MVYIIQGNIYRSRFFTAQLIKTVEFYGLRRIKWSILIKVFEGLLGAP